MDRGNWQATVHRAVQELYMTEVTIWLTQILFTYFILKMFFLMWIIFKVFIEFVTILLPFFMFWFIFFGCTAHKILAFWPRIEPVSPALKAEVLTTGPPGKSQAKEFLELTFTILGLFLVLLYEIFVLSLSQVPYRKLLKTLDCLEWERECLLYANEVTSGWVSLDSFRMGAGAQKDQSMIIGTFQPHLLASLEGRRLEIELIPHSQWFYQPYHPR